MGTAVAEAQQKVKKQVRLPEGYTLKWTGDFENQQRATKRLAQVVPVSIAIIFIILSSSSGMPAMQDWSC